MDCFQLSLLCLFVFNVFDGFYGVVAMFENTIELIDHEKCAFIDYNKYIAMMCKEEIARFLHIET